MSTQQPQSRHKTTTQVKLEVPNEQKRPKTPDTFEREFNSFFRNHDPNQLGDGVFENLATTRGQTATAYDPFFQPGLNSHFRDFTASAFSDMDPAAWARDIPLRTGRYSYGPGDIRAGPPEAELAGGIPPQFQQRPDGFRTTFAAEDPPRVFRVPPSQAKQFRSQNPQRRSDQYFSTPNENIPTREGSPSAPTAQYNYPHKGGSPSSPVSPGAPGSPGRGRKVHWPDEHPQSPLASRPPPTQSFKLFNLADGADGGLRKKKVSASHDDLSRRDDDELYKKHGPGFTLFKVNDPNAEISEEFPNRERQRKLSRQNSQGNEQVPAPSDPQPPRDPESANQNSGDHVAPEFCPDWQANVQTTGFHKRHLSVLRRGHQLLVSAKKTVESIQMGRQEITKQWQVMAPETIDTSSLRITYDDSQAKMVISGQFDQGHHMQIFEASL